MIEINKYRLTSTGLSTNQGKLIPGATTYWGFIAGNITEQEDLVSWVEGHGYLTEHQPLKTVNGQSLVGTGNIQIDASVPSYYATKAWVQSQGYLVSDDLSQYATRQWVVGSGYITSSALEGYATESWVSSNFLGSTALTGYATESWVSEQGFITSENLPSGIATESWVEAQGYLTSENLPSDIATQSWVDSIYVLKSYASNGVSMIINSSSPGIYMRDTISKQLTLGPTIFRMLGSSYEALITPNAMGVYATDLSSQKVAGCIYDTDLNEAVFVARYGSDNVRIGCNNIYTYYDGESSIIPISGLTTQSWVQSQSYLTSASTMMTDIESRLSSIEATLGQAVQITNDILS